MANIFTEFTASDDADEFAEALFLTPSGISYVGGSATYTGVRTASSFFDSLNLGQAVVPTSGVLLTSGDGSPPLANGQAGYTDSNSAAGDTDLDTEVQNAFSGAGATEDASVLEFKIDVAEGVKSVSFDVVFASDEFPEFSNTSFVDIAGIFVNGENVALFGGKAKNPLSILDNNLKYFQDNQDGGISIEYDGVSNKLKVIAEVEEGLNTIKIAIADTGDTLYDSGIFVSNLQGSTLGLSSIVNELLGTDGKDKLKAVKGADNILFGEGGKDKLKANTGFDILFGDQDGTASETLALEISKDKFIFKSSKFSSKKLKKADVIGDFDKKDLIDISKLAGSKIDFIGKHKFSDDGDAEVRYQKKKGKDLTAIYVDKDGDGKTELALKLEGIHKLSGDDFVL